MAVVKPFWLALMTSAHFAASAGDVGGAGCGQLSAASTTSSPRAPHALVFSSCLSGCMLGWAAAARGSTASRAGCFPLHGYRQSCSAVGSHAAKPLVHWTAEKGKPCFHWPRRRARRLSGLARLGSSRSLETGSVNILVCFCQWRECLPAAEFCRCVQTEAERLWGAESGESEANWLSALPCALWFFFSLSFFEERPAPFMTFWQHYRRARAQPTVCWQPPFFQSLFSIQMSSSVSLYLSRSAAATPQAACYPFGAEQSCGVSGPQRGK